MTPAADALAVLAAWLAPDGAQELLRREYVDLLRRRPDATSRDCLPDHLTASTLVVSADHTRCLLTLHAKAGRWFQLGGHCEPTDLTLAAAARREAEEESGLAGLAVDPVPVQLDAHVVPFCGGPGTRHLDVRYLAVAPRAPTSRGREPVRRRGTASDRAAGPVTAPTTAGLRAHAPAGRRAEPEPAASAPRPSPESADLRWWPLDRLPTHERSVVDLVRLAQERLSVR